ncbi:MAG: nitroreductase family deazaflavin-dependent oxidoreductase [Rhodococcus sp. (in: high G+C Gram-positive bacteria)]
MRKKLVPVLSMSVALVMSAGAGEHKPGGSERTPRLQPRWFIVLFWKVHRALFRVTGGRLGLWPARAQRWGAMRLTTTGRRSGQARSVILGYIEDGPNLVTLAMNGWGEGEPAWWLNLQAHPQVRVQLADGTREVVATPRPARSGPGCGTDGGQWTRISTATPVADHRLPW